MHLATYIGPGEDCLFASFREEFFLLGVNFLRLNPNEIGCVQPQLSKSGKRIRVELQTSSENRDEIIIEFDHK